VSPRAREAARLHTRLLKCALEIETSRAYWARTDGSQKVSAKRAFEEYWFGSKSLRRIEILLADLRARYDAFPPALAVLHRWPRMSPDVRRTICHWHLQLADPLYRAFTGDYLAKRRATDRPTLGRDVVVGWVGEQGQDRWNMATKIQFASKLLSAACAAGLLGAKRDPRPLTLPSVPDEALAYLLYLLREVAIESTLLCNPYLRSLGLEGPALEDRLRALPGLTFRRQGDLIDFGWQHEGLLAWADAHVAAKAHSAGAAS
jgi:hypothetical protein